VPKKNKVSRPGKPGSPGSNHLISEGRLNPDQIRKQLQNQQELREKLLRGEILAPDRVYAPGEPEEGADPSPMEMDEARPAETPKEQVDQKAHQLKILGPGKVGRTGPLAVSRSTVNRSVPNSMAPASNRPSPPNTKAEQGSVIVAKHLAPQLLSSPEFLAEGRWDERKLAVLKEGDLAAMSHFSYRYVYDGIRYWGHITEWWLTGSQGVGGLGRQHALKAIGASTGAQSIEKARKPGVLARNLWNKNWKEKALIQGQEPEE